MKHVVCCNGEIKLDARNGDITIQLKQGSDTKETHHVGTSPLKQNLVRFCLAGSLLRDTQGKIPAKLLFVICNTLNLMLPKYRYVMIEGWRIILYMSTN